MTPSQRYLSITNPVERANDLLKLYREQIVITDAAWAECVQQLIRFIDERPNS